MRFFLRRKPAPELPSSTARGRSLIEVGRFTYGHEKAKILEWGEGKTLRIGSFCSISAEVSFFLGGEHRTDWVSTFPFGHVFVDELGLDGPPVAGHPISRGDVSVGNDVWIGRGATLLSGVTIGDGAVIGARAVVASDVPPYAIVAGNPAKVIRYRFEPEIVCLLLQLRWWDLPIHAVRKLVPMLTTAPSVPDLQIAIRDYSRFLAADEAG